MSKQYRYVVVSGFMIAALVVGLLVVSGRTPAVAQGDPEAQESAGQLGIDIEAVLVTPSDWDYDPDARFIHDEESDIKYPINLTEEQWKRMLDPIEYNVLREKGTERGFTGPLNDNKEAGIYYSRATGQPLFSSEDKYDSRSGWPSFTRPINPDAIVYIDDSSLFAQRIEVVDSLSGSHLGHVFPDGPAPTGQRYCINSASLLFVPEGEDPSPILEELRKLTSANS